MAFEPGPSQNVKIKELYGGNCILKLWQRLYLIYNYKYLSSLSRWGTT